MYCIIILELDRIFSKIIRKLQKKAQWLCLHYHFLKAMEIVLKIVSLTLQNIELTFCGARKGGHHIQQALGLPQLVRNNGIGNITMGHSPCHV